MLQFTPQEMASIRHRASTHLIKQIIDDNQVVMNSEILIPPDARATWNLYYFCPEHGVRLIWNRYREHEHVCPVDGEVLKGEPYDGAWWRWLNGLNSKACNDLGLLWQLTQDQQYLDKVKDILLGYAEFYPDYEEHGGIPYNGPGKANAQTLCEANCNLDFAKGYDFIKDELSLEQQLYIEQRLLKEGAKFLMKHRSDQLHNHEMKISATIGVIGLVLDEPLYVDFAVHSNYGLVYQLEHGVKGEGLWFEGSIHYHYYALQALLNFELMACKTTHSLKSHPNFYTMLAFPLKLLMNTGDFPRLNDCIAGQEKLSHSHLFEFAYREFNDPLFASALTNIYQHSERNNIHALLYGVETLPELNLLSCNSMHAPVSGITIMHEPLENNMLLLKHSSYGGEHDHYDRLGLILTRNGKEILPDLGTTGYGAELHYGYYKNTLTHNTLAVGQSNQAPATPKVNAYRQTKDYTWLDTTSDWNDKPLKVDSHTIVQWDEDAYKGVVFTRRILWLGDVAIEFNSIDNPRVKQLDLVWHVRGEHVLDPLSTPCKNPMEGPLERMTNSHTRAVLGSVDISYTVDGQQNFEQQIVTQQSVDLLQGYAPDNPAVSDLAYTILRSKEPSVDLAVVHNLSQSLSIRISQLKWEENRIRFALFRDDKLSLVEIDLVKGELIQSAI
ncbi:alginate lyase [Alginatibacterium sediminis]|uniref:Alginate lyase n=1 Tax=Alginatibacterium sediminis TaxID=2164068 RepID=A0A420EB29_9ALTE|nr:heparinase II/III family protein [Alginatibacterium sediminis]RKF17888.1 alginate lyase [Alginatibacterium sediminis]